MNDSIKEIIFNVLDEKLSEFFCEICQSGAGWEIESYIFKVNIDSTTSLPVVTAICRQCGNVKMFSAVKLGLVKKDKS